VIAPSAFNPLPGYGPTGELRFQVQTAWHRWLRPANFYSHIEHIERHREWPFAVGADALIVGIFEGAQVIHHRGVVFGWCSRVARWWVPGCTDRNVTIAK
jgi:hypothetical protein